MGKSPGRARSPPRVRTSRSLGAAQGLRSQTDNPNALSAVPERLTMHDSNASNQQVPSRGHSEDREVRRCSDDRNHPRGKPGAFCDAHDDGISQGYDQGPPAS